MVAVPSPLEGDYSTSKTFHLKSLPCYTHTFTSIKDRLRVSTLSPPSLHPPATSDTSYK